MYMVSASFLPMFSYDLIQGDEATALEKPYTVVLSQSAAKRYFGEEETKNKNIIKKIYIWQWAVNSPHSR